MIGGVTPVPGLALVMVIVCVLFLLYVVVRSSSSSQLQTSQSLPPSDKGVAMPGPSGWPIVGCALELDANFSHLTLEKWAKEYGGLYKVKIGGEVWVVPAKYEYIHEVLVDKTHAFAGRFETFRITYTNEGQGLFVRDPTFAEYGAMRHCAVTHTAMLGNGNSPLDPVLTDLLEQLVSDMRAHGGHAVDLRNEMTNHVTSCIYALFTGAANVDDDRLQQCKIMIQNILACSGREGLSLDVAPWLRYLGNDTFSRLKRAVALKALVWDKMWANGNTHSQSQEGQVTAAEGDSEVHACLIDAMRDLANPASPRYNSAITDDVRRGLFSDLLVAGVIGTSALAYALPNILLHHSHVYTRMQAEGDTVTGKSGRRPTLHDPMPYTWAVIYELLRYVTVVPLANRRTLEDTTIAGHRLAAGTVVMVHFWAMHHDNEFWGDPDVFRPERFLDDSGQLLPADHPHRTHLMGHGAGLRSCAGALFSQRRLFLFAAYLAQTFDLQGDDITPLVSCNPRTYTMSNLLVVPSYRIKLVPRQPVL